LEYTSCHVYFVVKESDLRKDYSKENVRLTSQDIATYCQVSKSTVLEWIKSGQLKAFSLPSGHYRIDKKDFKKFLEKWDMPIKGWLFGNENEKEGNKK
jgi:excisionase family DNA binding protein